LWPVDFNAYEPHATSYKPLPNSQLIHALERRPATAADDGVAIAALDGLRFGVAFWAVHGFGFFFLLRHAVYYSLEGPVAGSSPKVAPLSP
jgi:hypothetical protein